MYGIKAFLIFLGFFTVAAFLALAVVRECRHILRSGGSKTKPIVMMLFVVLWISMITSSYVTKAHFHYVLWKLDPSDVYSIQIGKHDFRDRASIDALVAAIRHNRWFEVNHGGWGGSIPMVLRRRAGDAVVLDVALYFREPGAIIGPANPHGLGSSGTQAFAPELPSVLERFAVKLPDCDTPHGRPCTAAQLLP